jgi:putative sigma-54 modulation protein
MRIDISARHLDLTKAISSYINKKVEKCQRYFDHLIWAHVIISVEKKYRHVTEVVIHARKMTFRAKEESIDIYSAIDLTLDKIEKQLKKYKDKVKKAHKSVPSSKKGVIKNKRRIMIDETPTAATLVEEIKKCDLKALSIREAINEMETLGEKFYMFLNEGTGQVNLVYLKDSNSYGLLEPRI